MPWRDALTHSDNSSRRRYRSNRREQGCAKGVTVLFRPSPFPLVPVRLIIFENILHISYFWRVVTKPHYHDTRVYRYLERTFLLNVSFLGTLRLHITRILVRRWPSPNIETRRGIVIILCMRHYVEWDQKSVCDVVRRKLELKNNTSATTTIWIKNAYVTSSSSACGRLTIIIYSRYRCTRLGSANKTDRRTYLCNITHILLLLLLWTRLRYLWFWKRAR